jgi:hypothetical protein
MIKKILFVTTTAIILLIFNSLHFTGVKAESKGYEPSYLKDTINEKPAEQVYKNIQVLKGMPASELIPTMRFMASSLGVRCDFCHVTSKTGSWPMDRDDKETKLTARKMITMMNQIDNDNFEGRRAVNCATCHNGNKKPNTFPPLFSEKRDIVFDKKTLPVPNTLLDKYIDAIGGKAVFEKIKTRVTKGEIIMANGEKEEYELYQSAPDKYLSTITSKEGVMLSGYNGTSGWMQTPNRMEELKGDELHDAKREAEFYREIELDKLYPDMRTTGMQYIGERKAYEVGAGDEYGNYIKLYFDTESGLLLRTVYYTRTSFGSIPEETNYDDYRSVDGIKLPFYIETHGTFFDRILKVTSIKNDVQIDEAKYNMPEKK